MTGRADRRVDAEGEGGARATGERADESSEYADRIDALADRASQERERFGPPALDTECAGHYLREGLGPTVAVYVEARTGGGSPVAFSRGEFARLERATNDWLALYAACCGVEMDPAFTVREVASVLLQTHDLWETASLLTTVSPPEDSHADRTRVE